jgi:uncharacterized lipoprotein YmbA
MARSPRFAWIRPCTSSSGSDRDGPRSNAVALGLALLGVALLILAACAGSKPSKFYILSASSAPGQSEQAPAAATGVSIGVGPVKIPDYLDRVQIVTRSTANALELAEYDRWAEPLDRSLPRLLAENLSALLPADNVVAFPWSGPAHVDYQVVVEVLQFDGTLGQKAWLEARWTILGEGGKQVRSRGNANLSESVGNASHEALVSGWSKALGGLSREIAASLRTLAHPAQ